ncbi:hypothetical protein [Microlunatus parietis]|uniref:Uncharacterized protein n=1 Tax=Microlunatus parietis TaxID=682979 RepID=A0A7Y9IDT0_9ACTN|nr:hypothetical protein [Microlunatus parietis]NYE74920.1 hypothetical protein [Microlunatus parietis]
MINSRVRAAAAGRHQTTRVLEYVGVVALAVVLVIGIALAGWGSELRTLTGQALCSLTPQQDCADRSPRTP